MSTRCITPNDVYVYLVGWPDHDVLKVGYTGHLRTRTARYICRRGGVLLGHRTYPDMESGFRAESRAADVLRNEWRRAFACRGDAAELLGQRGSGWTECLSVPAESFEDALSIFERTLYV